MTSSMPGDLSYAERRMWFLDRLRPGGTDYLLPYIFRIGGPLRVDALTATLTRLHQRHDVLRCTYRTEAGEPRRVVHPAGESAPALTIVDLTGHAPRERERRAREVLARDQRTPFDLGREHPVRWLLIELTGTEHLLVLTAHHIAFDAWSGHVVFEEFGALYDAEVAGVTPALAPIQVDYATHAVRQRERFLRGELDGSLAFWEGELDGMAALDLPLDHPRPRIWRPDGASVDVSVPPALAKALTALGRSAGATRFMTALTVFTGLLARLSGQSDISVGTAVSGRDDGRTHETVGLFVNTVVLRSTVEAETTFRDLLGRTVITTLTAMEHPELPFDVLVERLRPERDLSANPLFQAMFLFEEAGGAAITAGGLHFEEVDVPPIAAKVDLTLALRHEADGGFTGHFEYATALFERAMIERFARLFVRLAEQAAAEPDRPLVELPLSTAAEHVAELGYREAPPAPVMTPELIAGQARRRPDAIAVAGPDGDLDYRTLARRAGDLAAALARAGVRRGDVVGLCVERGPHLVSALAGIMSSGAAVLWLDPAHPRERLLGLLADGGAVLVVAAGPDRAGLDDCGLPILPADAVPPPSGPVPLPRIGPDDVAYIAYTSGSTGRPKGVQISHGALAEHLEVIATEFRITAGARISLAASLGFDVSLEQILTALVRGARVVPLDPRRLGADDLLDEIGRHRLTHLNLTPLYYRELIGRAKPRDRRLDSVEMVYLAGDVIRGDDLQRWRDGGFGGAFVCAYGPTEATVTCTAMDTAGFTGRESILPIGRAVPGTRAYVLDGRLQPVPVGVPGELYLAGRRVALGYAGRPAATAGAFLPDPFGAEPGARMYRTGDLVRRRPDGVLEFRGRVDRQIKVRGHRVEPEEVESALLAHPRVRAAAVVHRPVGATGEPGLVAYAVLSDSVRGDAGLGDYLRERLPSYLVPAAIVTLAELPRTSSGKLDHDGLPEPVLIRPDLGAEMVAPRTTAEKALVAAISHVLGIEGVGVHDDFFRLGGNSLAATRLVARLRDHAGLVLPLREVFGTPTAAALAARATPVTGTAGDEPVRADRTGPIVLSAAQRRLWVLHQVDASGWEYVVPATFRLRGPLDTGALRAACRLLAERHEILRTRYVVVPGSGPAQIVDPAGEVPVEVVEPAGRSAEEVVGEAATRGFDLGRDHQFRVTLVRAAPDEHILLLLSHHIAVDGWSWKIIGTELAALYRALTATDLPAAPLPAPAWQYADHAVHEAARDLDDQVAYWRRTLAGSEPLDLPLDRPRPETRDPSGAVWAFRVPAEDARAVLELGRDAGATEFATWFALYAALLSRVTGQRDLVIGTPVDCRGTAGAETVLGCFVNTLAVRVPRVGETFRTHLAAVRSLLAQAHGHREAPFDRVLAELGRDRDPSRTPLFDTMFQVLEGAGQAFSLAGLTVTPVESLPPSAVTDLTLAMRANPDGSWTGELEYATALFEPATVMRLGERFAHLAAEVAARPGAVLADIDLRTERERTATGAPYAERPRTVLELFADQVARVPDAVAVTGPSGSVTYRELDDRSRRLARRLAAAGVEPGAAVAVYAGRSVRTVVALLAVLRRAAVYVPLNEADPPERREALLDETGAVAVVTDEPHATEFAEGGRLVFCDDDQPDDGLITDDPAGAALTDLAYVIFTSGSTGLPKGVMIDHAAFTHHCQVMADAYGLAPGERLALLASLGFDASMDQIMAPLISGAAVAVLDARAVSPAKMLHDLYDHAVTVVDVTPVYYRELLHAAVPDDPRLARLRLMSVGGDVVTGEDALAWHALGTGAAFGCTYGPTEATIACTFLVADEAEARRAGRHPLPLGRPLPGSRLLVLDSDQRPVLPGATGELYAGGPRVARGYLNRPELTADRFVPDPSGPPGARLYRTGDLVRMRPDGVLTFLGRTDRQVKIRGFRVEPAEIEAVLSALPGVRAAAVVPGPLPSGEQGLLGFVVPAAGARLEAADVRSAVRSRLPRHLVPAALTIIDELPLTPNGKLDQALLLRSRAAPAEQAPDRELDPTERAVAGIWTEVLGLSGLGPGDDFFVLGGHSLSATRAGMRLQEIFGIELPMHRLFTATTVESLAVVVREAVTASLDALSDAEIVALAAQDLEADPR
ncbi:amino acid adenylation domain-containing protein [Nonomuraea solani]|uniref:Amino acid adenylation domain-containing protein n=1 Tax=Nonomuraea solani TaxID=1144553 RepID=A0A1H6ECZ0_9ACTN|nr:non-ribosomal peptide synthetase [Nonomuraea solani]SEG95622.1 amino acid adenylation domain-containing protein [Nonomuraea solani]